MNVTFLITYFAHEGLLDICLGSIKRYHPDSNIVISQQLEDHPIRAKNIKLISHDMRKEVWADVARRLLENCNTDIAVFIEHDAFLLKSLQPLIEMIKDGKYDLIGPEENIPISKLNRNYPGMVCQNFFIVNAKKIKELGLNNIKTRIEGYESAHGISQVLDKKLFLPVKESGYAHGTFYGDYIHHLWYGSYPKRNIEYDGVNRLFLESESERLIKDYYNDEIRSLHGNL
jgi:hypothetical protein